MSKSNPELEQAFRDRLEQARQRLAQAGSVVALTGAGISAESGIPTFRGAGGLWQGRRVEDVATPEGFRRDPTGVWDWYHHRRRELRQARPNPGHYALARLEEQVARRDGWMVLATQNIDGLHHQARSRNVLELHGTMRKIHCVTCAMGKNVELVDLEPVPRCESCGGLMRPSVVWFGEALPPEAWQTAAQAADQCEVFLTVGTSAAVYPAAGLIDIARQGGAYVIEVNLEPTPATVQADAALMGKAGSVLPMLVD